MIMKKSSAMLPVPSQLAGLPTKKQPSMSYLPMCDHKARPPGSGQPNRSDLEFYRVTDQAHFVGRDIFRRRIHRDAAVFDIEV